MRLPSANLKFHGPIIKIRHHWFLLCWLMMLIGQQKLVTAFAPRLSRTALPTFQRPLPRFRLQATAKKKSTSGSAKRKPYSLVVHGPTADFSVKKISKRPFKLVIVESPSKCQTIAKILQQYVSDQNLEHDYVVTSCMGHIRNIPQKKTHKNETIAGINLEPQEGDPTRYRPTYTILPEKEQLVEDLKALSDRAQQLVLATDDDREGEAMAWHLLQVLLEEEGGGDAKHAHQLAPLRVRFTEITPKAILQSIQNPETSLNTNLVKAQETRRILDRLAGFTVSPILWKKIAPGLSAGRVQSVGMALIVQRERERLLFKETEYWDGQADFSALSDQFQGTLVSISGTQLASGGTDFEPREANALTESSSHKLHLKRDDAEELFQRLNQNKEDWQWTVANITATQRKLNPSPPFITSTLQQEANKRLGLSVSRSMQTAQQLYEKGFISYMRTDSNHLSDDAKAAIKTEITKDYGGPDFYQPTTAKAKQNKKKSDKPKPQAAHEAIRPAIQDNGRFAKPSDLPDTFDGAAKQLYELIYQRTVASHMPPQVSNQTTIRILGENEDTQLLFRTSGSVVIKPGFSNVYPRQAEKDSPLLPGLREGQKIDCNEATPLIHITQAPARYTEASFVQELEALGVGRPSTYAGTVQILRDRAYVGSPVTSDSARSGPGKVVSGTAISAQRAAGGEEFTGSQSARGPLVPSLTAFVVCSLLETRCSMYVDPSFTAGMEERLDRIANAEENVSEDERVAYLDEFYAGDNGLAAQIDRIHDSVDADDARRARLPALEWNSTNGEEIGLFVGPWGPYVKKVTREESGDGKKPVSAPLPAGMAADLSIITLQNLKGVLATKEEGGTILGQHPDDGRNIRLMVGRFGAYLQLGEGGEDGTTTHTLPRSVRNMKNINGEQAAEGDGSLNNMLGISFEEAVQYANLPRTVCKMNELPILAAIGPYGPYLKYNSTFLTLKPADGDVLTIEPESAQTLVTEGIVNRKSKLGAGVLEEVGEKEGTMITVKSGRFGMYINWKRVNAKMPMDYLDNPSELPLEEAWSLIQEKAGSDPKPKKGKNAASGVELPPAPKRPISAYLHFCAEKRPELSATFKSLGLISKELARLWAETSDEDRKPYMTLNEAAKNEYDDKKRKWTEECQALLEKAGESKPSRIKGSRDGPKRPKSAYLFFSSARRPEVSQTFTKLGDVSKEIARLWAETKTSERKEYEDMAAEDKLRYETEKLDAISKGTATKNGRATGKKKTTAGKKKTAGTKNKRGPSAYMLFCAAHRNDIVDENGKKLPLGETTKRLAQMWKDCDDDTRAGLMEEADKQKALV